MNLPVTLAELAAGTATILMLGRRLGSGFGPPPPPMDFHAPLRAEDLESCPACGADSVRFAYEEEVDATGDGVEVVRCSECGWKQPLLPL